MILGATRSSRRRRQRRQEGIATDLGLGEVVLIRCQSRKSLKLLRALIKYDGRLKEAGTHEAGARRATKVRGLVDHRDLRKQASLRVSGRTRGLHCHRMGRLHRPRRRLNESTRGDMVVQQVPCQSCRGTAPSIVQEAATVRERLRSVRWIRLKNRNRREAALRLDQVEVWTVRWKRLLSHRHPNRKLTQKQQQR